MRQTPSLAERGCDEIQPQQGGQPAAPADCLNRSHGERCCDWSSTPSRSGGNNQRRGPSVIFPPNSCSDQSLREFTIPLFLRVLIRVYWCLFVVQLLAVIFV